MLTSTVGRHAAHLVNQGDAAEPGKAVVVRIWDKQEKSFFWDFHFQVRFSVQGDSLELPTESEAYTLGVKEEGGNLVVNIVADTYFGAR